MATQLERDKHARYLLHCLREVPQPYAALDTSRLSLAYFCVAGLDVLAQLGKIDAPLRAGIVEWIYSLQVLPPLDGCAGLPADRLGGFRGSGYLGAAHSSGGAPSSSPYDSAHLAMTYTALAVLLTLGDDLSRVDQPRVLAFVSSLQDEAGCFSAYPGGERDMRFLFCAAAVVAMLRGGAVPPSSGIDVERATRYVLESRGFDGGFGLGPGQESHGGSTFTGLAALALMGTLRRLPQPQRTVRWCVERQVGGFQGRPNKDEDTCYSFWIGGSLALLGAATLLQRAALSAFCLSCQFAHPTFGGIAKHPDTRPDLLHTHYALCGLSLAGAAGLAPLEPRLGITARAAARARGCEAEGECQTCEEETTVWDGSLREPG